MANEKKAESGRHTHEHTCQPMGIMQSLGVKLQIFPRTDQDFLCEELLCERVICVLCRVCVRFCARGMKCVFRRCENVYNFLECVMEDLRFEILLLFMVCCCVSSMCHL